MKNLLKKSISVFLVFVMLITSVLFASAANVRDSSNRVELSISNQATYSWGDSICFDVTITNNTQSRITNVNLVSEVKGAGSYFEKSGESTGAIEYITPGASRTAKIVYSAKSGSILASIVRCIVTLFNKLFSKFSRGYAYEQVIKVGLSNVVFGIDVEYEVANQTNSSVNLDDPDQDIEIYSFMADTHDIPIGETSRVTFTAEVFSNIDLTTTTVSVYDNNNNEIGVMNDSGRNGDDSANDGVYSLSVNLSSEEVCTRSYYSSVDGEVSDDVTISFYKHYSEDEIDDLSLVVETINNTASNYIDANGALIPGKLSEAMRRLSSEMATLVVKNIVSSYETVDNVFYVQLVNGLEYRYEFSDSGTDNMMVSVQPYKQDEDRPYSEYLQELSDDATDTSARLVAAEIDEYSFTSYTTGNELNTFNDSNYDRHEVTIENMVTIINADVFAWHGHGGYGSIGSMMALGELYTPEVFSIYEDDISADRIVLSNGRFCITGGFIEKYAGNLDGHFVYLGTCSSSEDMEDENTQTSWELAREFIKKGAVVVGNTNTIRTAYNTQMEAAVFSILSQKDDSGNYYTLSEALDYAKELYGEFDTNGTEVKIYPETEEARNYRLHSETNGAIAGVIKNASNRNVLEDALVRVYKGDTLIATERTNANGSYNISLPAGEYIVKVSAGSFKNAKMGVTVRANATTYNETFMLIYNGYSGGYANGNTINAITGRLLPDVKINIRSSWNNYEGRIIESITSNSNGYYEVSIPAGVYTFECYKDDFITTYKNVLVYNDDYEAQNISLAPELTENYYRVVLTWGENPFDLDSHLFGKTDNYSYHVYYSDKDGYDSNGQIVANLDVDDVTSYGPETTTFYVDPNGQYDFYIDWYSGSGTWANSGGTVEVYSGAYLINTYYVPSVNNKSGSWRVFSINNGVYTSYNTMTEDIY